jgi:hypothetical protein
MKKKSSYMLPTWLIEMIVKKRFTIKYRMAKKYRYAVVRNGKISYFK